VDFVQRVNESGFEIRPPKPRTVARPRAHGGAGPGVLDQQVNPAIASHGGRIDLVDVEDTEVYMEMSGGCQGCAMSRMTLRQGVEKMIRQAVPEVTAIHDVTDHSAGEPLLLRLTPRGPHRGTRGPARKGLPWLFPGHPGGPALAACLVGLSYSADRDPSDVEGVAPRVGPLGHPPSGRRRQLGPEIWERFVELAGRDPMPESS
jgi:Fe-S cluster biogenesis protein NfuA